MLSSCRAVTFSGSYVQVKCIKLHHSTSCLLEALAFSRQAVLYSAGQRGLITVTFLYGPLPRGCVF